jgi:hypothetical protein
MGIRRCLACGRLFRICPQAPDQSYCNAIECQRERRRRWQRERRNRDRDYRANQAAAHQRWAKKHPDYWREYRKTHPEYVSRNREQQRQRRGNASEPDVAKMDVSRPASPLATGIYLVSRIDTDPVAKVDAWIAQITVLSAT